MRNKFNFGGRIIITPLLIIDAMRESDPYIKTIYTEGGCYQFHLLLKQIYPDAIPVINAANDHVGTLIDGVLYDINGFATWSYRGMDDDDISMAERWNFADHNMLKIRECPICEEPIVV